MRESSRAELLRRAAVAGGAAAAGGALLAAGARSAPSRELDVRVLRYLLRLEYVMAGFYEQAGSRGSLSGDLRRFAEVVGGHEREHIELLRDLLGADAGSEPQVRLPADALRDEQRVAATARMLEENATAGYIGQGANLTAEVMVDVARITSVEGRHAAWIAAILDEDPAPEAADAAKSSKTVAAAIEKAGITIAG